jgi:succinoglycan biosynthesis protein ExoA
VAVAYRRDVFEKVGFFDERFDACEDYEFNHRVDNAGLTCYFTPDVAVNYQPRGTLVGLFRQLARYGRGRVRLWRKHPDTLTWKSLAPGMLVAGWLIGPALPLVSWPLAVCWPVCALLYLAIVLFCSAQIAVRNRSLSSLLLTPLVFVAIHFGAGSGILCEWLWGRKRDYLSSGGAAP